MTTRPPAAEAVAAQYTALTEQVSRLAQALAGGHWDQAADIAYDELTSAARHLGDAATAAGQDHASPQDVRAAVLEHLADSPNPLARLVLQFGATPQEHSDIGRWQPDNQVLRRDLTDEELEEDVRRAAAPLETLTDEELIGEAPTTKEYP